MKTTKQELKHVHEFGGDQNNECVKFRGKMIFDDNTIWEKGIFKKEKDGSLTAYELIKKTPVNKNTGKYLSYTWKTQNAAVVVSLLAASLYFLARIFLTKNN